MNRIQASIQKIQDEIKRLIQELDRIVMTIEEQEPPPSEEMDR